MFSSQFRFANRPVYEDILEFVDQMVNVDIDLKGTGVTRDKKAILDVYRKLYIPEN